jgi:glycosyltransferase involved in cell wall biosynthesis
MLRGFGVDLVVDQLAEGLSSRGHEVTVYASVSDDSFRAEGYELKLIPTPAYSFFPRYDLSAQKYLGFLNQEGNDVYLIQTFPFFSYLPRLKAPAVAVEYGVSSTEGFPPKVKANFAYVKFMQHQVYFRWARRVATISRFLKEGLPRHLKSKAEVIYLGAEHYRRMATESTPAEAAELRQSLGVAEDEILLLYVGRLAAADQPYKGTAELVALYGRLRAKHPQIRLLMVGFGGPKEKAWLEGEGVLVIENAPAEQMPAVFSACDIYTTASRWEGFDLPLVEAQSFGKPVVALRIGAHPEVVAEGWSGYLTGTVEEMDGAIVRLATDEAARQKMGKEASANADRFRWARAVEQYERLLQELVS